MTEYILSDIARRIRESLRRWFLTPAALTAGVLLFLSGCGQIEQQTAELAPTPSGFYVDSTAEARMKDLFKTVEECAEMKGDFDALTFVMMPPAFPCTESEGKRCNGEFITPNTIKIDSFFVARHEILHYLLYLNTGDPDQNHTDPRFNSCA